ncbi:MAG TPA: hypothetical protein VLZ12_00600, partial [Verrucomicrobiae bacterium]|nr:hypothetical protein [Verrucomicrobiae bacterium]
MTLKKKVVLSIVGALVLAVVVWSGVAGYCMYRMAHVRIPNCYAAWTTGDLLVEYLRTHGDKWPHSWDDLRDA